MIHYNLQCSNAHIFDEWFDSSASCDFQLKRKMLICPKCNDHDIEKALMAPGIPSKGGSSTEEVEPPFEDVGKGFAKEVKDMHHGYAEGRNISGVAPIGDMIDLVDSGVGGLQIKGIVDD